MALGPSYYLVSVEAVAVTPLVVASWGGSVLASLLKKVYQDSLVRVSPLFSDGRWVSGSPGRPVTLGRGSRVSFSFLVRAESLVQAIPSWSLELPGGSLRVLEASIEEVGGVEHLRRYAPRVDGDTITLRFSPTMLMFRGRRVLYPSPRRLILSAARSLFEATGLDLRGAAERVSCRLELVAWRGGVSTLSIGRGRTVKAFHGDAVYAVDEDLGADSAVLSLILAAAHVFGVGRSRGIGFGHVAPGGAGEGDTKAR